MLNYKDRVSPESVFIIFYDEVEPSSTIAQAKAVCSMYGLKFCAPKSLDEMLTIIKTSSFSITHSILRLKDSFTLDVLETLRNTRGSGYTSSSIAFSYRSTNEALKFENEINIQKGKAGNLECINIMRPDEFRKDQYVVSELKLLDNIVCDTIRLKYNTKCLSNESLSRILPESVKDYFVSCSHIYGDLHMYHRSDTDGYFAMRHNGSLYITATKSPKGRGLDLDRITCLEGYDRQTNTISYRGAYLPSSDAVEAFVVFDTIKNIHQIIHTHDSKRFTRNKQAEKFPRIGSLPYGEPELGDKIARLYQSTQSPLIIMEEHGEVFFGTHDNSAINNITSAISQFCNHKENDTLDVA
ncbi:hypothetical protein AKG98_463 [Moritella sp. JT01]|uniref:hypothetical protein n=1 Tax=Moritella sp. JT01 TaxID=756698 RepID=UPI00079A4B56|nr:hypothetical protein [Moritella sp. JT01]KXO11553.1 hypothetical protein AKG98_463 [Moritella sp. JT01]